jgi:hypothetical protein
VELCYAREEIEDELEHIPNLSQKLLLLFQSESVS